MRKNRAIKIFLLLSAFFILSTCQLQFNRAGNGLDLQVIIPENSSTVTKGIGIAKNLFAISPQKGAQTIVYLVSSPEVASVTGGYFARSRPATPTAAAQDDAAAGRLWAESARLAGLPG